MGISGCLGNLRKQEVKKHRKWPSSEDQQVRLMTKVELIVEGEKLKNDDSLLACGLSSDTSVQALYTIDSTECSSHTESGCHPQDLLVVVIPNTAVRIDNDAFRDCTFLASVSIPNSIQRIHEGAFKNCSSLLSVQIPHSVTRIGPNAFRACSSLRDLSIGNGVFLIGEGAFQGCSSLGSLNIPDSVKDIGPYAFEDCSSLASVMIPNGVNYIGEDAFKGCSALASVTIPSSIAHVGPGVFGGCSALASLTIPNSVTYIEGGAFANCCSLKTLDIPDSVIIIGDGAFKGCNSLESLTIPKPVRELGFNAFEDCTSLVTLTINDSVKSIGEKAFKGCTALRTLQVPSLQKTRIGPNAFEGCPTQPMFLDRAGCRNQWCRRSKHVTNLYTFWRSHDMTVCQRSVQQKWRLFVMGGGHGRHVFSVREGHLEQSNEQFRCFEILEPWRFFPFKIFFECHTEWKCLKRFGKTRRQKHLGEKMPHVFQRRGYTNTLW